MRNDLGCDWQASERNGASERERLRLLVTVAVAALLPMSNAQFNQICKLGIGYKVLFSSLLGFFTDVDADHLPAT